MQTPTDKAMDAMAAPSSDVIAALALEYTPALKRYFARKAGAEAADDLVQEVFLYLQKRAERGSIENAEKYLFTVAKWVLLMRRRSDVRHPSGAFQPLDEAFGFADELSPERILEAKQDYEQVLVSIVNLPPRMRAAFMLHRFGKLSFSAIAERMGIKKSTVQTLMNRAMRHVLEELEKGR